MTQDAEVDCLARLDMLLEAFNQQAPAESGCIEFIAVTAEHQGMGLSSICGTAFA